jgi:hypothetical protein
MNHATPKHERPPAFGTPGLMTDAERTFRLRRAIAFAHLAGVSARPTTKPRTPSPLKLPASATQRTSDPARPSAAEIRAGRAAATAGEILRHGAATGRTDLACRVAFGSPSAQDVLALFDD